MDAQETARGGGDEGPRDTIPIQPRPVLTRVVRFHTDGKTVTAIMRHWKPGDSGPRGRCRLCPLCKAYGDGCLVMTDLAVARESAPLFASLGVPENGVVAGHAAGLGGRSDREPRPG